MKFTIITLFAEALKPYLDTSMMWKAQEKGALEIEFVNLRDFGLGPHKSVDDTPYGGGDGMLLRCEPVFAAIESVKEKDPEAKVILPTPAGELWTQKLARDFAGIDTQDGSSLGCFGVLPRAFPSSLDEQSSSRSMGPSTCHPKTALAGHRLATAQAPYPLQKDTQGYCNHYIILCPHYEGYDERILSIVDFPISLGSFVLTGGELPALIIIDSIVRLLPGVLGGETSAEVESFSEDGVIEFPQYTKPAEFRGMKVPEVLLSGHHGKVDEWRKEHSKRANY